MAQAGRRVQVTKRGLTYTGVRVGKSTAEMLGVPQANRPWRRETLFHGLQIEAGAMI